MSAHICNQKKKRKLCRKKFIVLQTRFKQELEEIQNSSEKIQNNA